MTAMNETLAAPQPAVAAAGAMLRSRPMSRYQQIVIGICIAINVLDGFDALASAFTAPAVAAQWQLPAALLGMLLSASVAGMALGSVLIAPLGDKLGRRPIVLGCLGMISAAMLASAFVANAWQLAGLRLVTGLGVGGIIAGINTLVAEYASDRRRDLALSMTTVGYAMGAICGGAASGLLVGSYGWRSVFLAGGLLSVLMVPVAFACLPESLDFLAGKRPGNALARLNRVLRKAGAEPLQTLPPHGQQVRQGSPWRALFHPDFRRPTLQACACYLLVMLTNYFLLSWMPKLLVDMGMSMEQGISGAVIMNLSGVVGGIALGWSAGRYGLRAMSVIYLCLCFLSVAWFGSLSAAAGHVLTVSAVIGFLITGAVACLNALSPRVFPPEVRATGTGLALGFGRLGGTAGPWLAGVLIQAGWSRAQFSIVLATPLLAAAVLFALVLAKERGTA